MSEFYTCVNRIGSDILYRGYDSKGAPVSRKIKFSPTLYLKGSKVTPHQSIDGAYVEPIKFDTMREAKDFINTYKDIENFKVYGNTNYIAQFIYEKFPKDIKYDRDLIRVATIDIEVASDDGFPFPEDAKHEVISIAIKSSADKTYYVWGMGDYDTSKALIQDHRIVYTKCDDEVKLLLNFLDYWSYEKNTPDVVTGWNTRLFDIPYLANRINRILGPEMLKKLSPWGIVNYRQIAVKGKQLDTYELYGIQQLDYYDLFQKFGYSYGAQESYKLDHIAYVVLGEKKLSYDDHTNMFGLLSSAEGVNVSSNKSIDELDELQKACRLRDNLRKEKELRGL